jgi:hypothetical protein
VRDAHCADRPPLAVGELPRGDVARPVLAPRRLELREEAVGIEDERRRARRRRRNRRRRRGNIGRRRAPRPRAWRRRRRHGDVDGGTGVREVPALDGAAGRDRLEQMNGDEGQHVPLGREPDLDAQEHRGRQRLSGVEVPGAREEEREHHGESGVLGAVSGAFHRAEA